MNKPLPMLALIEQHTISDKKTKTIPLAGLTTKGMQLRVSVDKEAIARYAESYAAGEELPAIVVFDDGGELLVADGHHRVAASEKAGKKSIECIIKKGDRRDALLYAARANPHHGVPLTNDDKRNIVKVMLGDAEWRKWSNHEIGRLTYTSPNFVGKLRKSLPKEQQTTVRKGKDGVERDTKNIGKAKAQYLPPAVDVCAYLVNTVMSPDTPSQFKWNKHGVCVNPIELTILPPPAKGSGYGIVITLGNGGDGQWRCGAQIDRFAPRGASSAPCGNNSKAFIYWQQAVRRALITGIIPNLEDRTDHPGGTKAIRTWLESVAQTLEEVSEKPDRKKARTKVEDPPADNDPEELNADTVASSAGDSAGEDLHKETPPLADDTEGARVLKRTREILADRLLKGKDQCIASSEQLVSLGLVIGIPVSADDEPWNDDLVAGCWHRFGVRLKAEVADYLQRGETRRMPPIEQLAHWWSIDIRAIAIQAERAVKG